MGNQPEFIDLDDIRVFVQVVRSGSFTAAARVLGLPKSSISRRIASLEEALGVRLLERSTRTLALNDVGRGYFARVAQQIDDLSDAARALQELDETPRGLLRLTAPPDPMWAQLVCDYQSRYPQVEVSLFMTTARIDLVAEGYDLAMRAGELGDSTLVARKLLGSRGVLCASPDYLARRGTPSRVSELSEHACLMFGTTRAAHAWTLLEDGQEVRVRVSGPLSCNVFGPLIDAAIAGHGIALVPDVGAAPAIADGRLVHVLPGASRPVAPLHAVYPSARLMTAKVRTFIDFATEVLQRRYGELLQCLDRAAQP